MREEYFAQDPHTHSADLRGKGKIVSTIRAQYARALRPYAVGLLVSVLCTTLHAQPPGPPPANVSLGQITEGALTPTAQFQGNVYFKEVSNLATEVSGLVTTVLFEEGDMIKQGTPIVRLDFELVESQRKAADAMYRQNVALLEQERTRLERAETLLREEVTTPQQFDDIKFTVSSLEHGAAATKAEVERLDIEISKKVTSAPYDGIVIDRVAEVGEWKSAGETLAVMARAGLYDIIFSLPAEYLDWIEEGQQIEVECTGRTIIGAVASVAPRGDVATRTFPIKIRVTGEDWLKEGMPAVARIPIGPETRSLMAPRDAVILQNGEQVVFVFEGGVAKRIPVTVTGYARDLAGISGNGFSKDAEVIVKGHERLRDGQNVNVLP